MDSWTGNNLACVDQIVCTDMTVSGIQQFDHIIVFMCLSFGLRQCSTVGDVNFVCASRSGLFLFRPVRVILVQAGRGYSCSGRSGLFLSGWSGLFLFRPVRVILVQAGRGYSCSGRSGLFLFRPVGVIVQAGQGSSCSGRSGLFLFRPVRVILFSSHRTTRSTSPSPSTISKPGWGAPPFTSLIAQMQVLFSVASQLTPV